MTLRKPSSRQGFTLIELLVGIAVGGIVLLAARDILAGISRGSGEVQDFAAAGDQSTLAERELRALARRVDVGSDSLHTFSATQTRFLFPSWCDVAGGQQKPCNVEVFIEDSLREARLRLNTSVGENITVRSGIGSASIRYLASPEAGGQWSVHWGRSLTAPHLVLLLLNADSLYLRLGGAL